MQTGFEPPRWHLACNEGVIGQEYHRENLVLSVQMMRATLASLSPGETFDQWPSRCALIQAKTPFQKKVQITPLKYYQSPEVYLGSIYLLNYVI
jgi:hypothetical protein